MYKSIIVSALAATAAALPHAARQAEEPLAFWPATDFVATCVEQDQCQASFGLSAPAGYVDGAPAFEVVCNPGLNQGAWVACEDVSAEGAAEGSSVHAQWSGADAQSSTNLALSHLYRQGEASYNASGLAATEVGATAFDIPVLTVTGVL